MPEKIRAKLTAGPLAFPWAERLAADWTVAGIEVSLHPGMAPATGPDEVHLRLVDSLGMSIEARWHLLLRKMNTCRPYLAFEVLAEHLRAKEQVDFEKVSDQAHDHLQAGIEAIDPARLENSILYLEPWLRRRHLLAMVILADLLSEIFVPDELGELPAIDVSVLQEGEESPPWLLVFEARRILRVASIYLSMEGGDEVSEKILREAKQLARSLKDPVLTTRADGMIGIDIASQGVLVPKDVEIEAKAYARADRAWRRAQKLRDLPAVVELGLLIAMEKRWADREAEGLAILEATAAYAAKHGGWLTPKLGHHLRYFRAIVKPSVETMTPLVEEILMLLEGGWTGWFPSLDYLELIHNKVGDRKFLRLLGSILGKKNAVQMAENTTFGRLEYGDRIERVAAHKGWREMIKQRAAKAAEEAAKPPVPQFSRPSWWPPFYPPNG